MHLVIVFPDYHVAKSVTSTTVVSCLVATSSTESLPNDGEKPNKSKKIFVSEMWLW